MGRTAEPDIVDVVIGGIGYRDLGDHSFGVLISDALGHESLAPIVEVHDLSYNPVAVGQWLEAMEPDERPRRLILIGAQPRGRPPGARVAYRWNGVLPDAGRVQEAVSDAVTGVIHLDNTLIVLAQFGPLPPEVVVIEVEPLMEEFGAELTPIVAQSVTPVKALARSLADGRVSLSGLPLCGLGGPPSASSQLSEDGAGADGASNDGKKNGLARMVRRL